MQIAMKTSRHTQRQVDKHLDAHVYRYVYTHLDTHLYRYTDTSATKFRETCRYTSKQNIDRHTHQKDKPTINVSQKVQVY